MVSKTWFSTSNKNKDLVPQTRMSKFLENGNLDKDDASGNFFDNFDSTRLALKMLFTKGKP